MRRSHDTTVCANAALLHLLQYMAFVTVLFVWAAHFGPLSVCGQVWRYLSAYANVASMPKREMFDLRELLTTARGEHAEWYRRRQRCLFSGGVVAVQAFAHGGRTLP